ncbi:hypothetical protein QWY22_10390 [Planococcus liqunii]|uniref:hypothetical protein n=1 Tax=Planococcus liqunii TaxID=3058394 RepID=UPI002624143B|nr:hypothetical protein [Planococcus sp. N056]WKA49317.1 hypothetical protein QWY22_10390 [Planococcus sp. N056]
MLKMNSLVEIAEKVGELLEAEAELRPEGLIFKKKRIVKEQKSSNVHVCWSLDLSVNVQSTGCEEATNKAEVFLLPEELPLFTASLIGNPILMPTNFSQKISLERGMYCVRLMSQEAPEIFAARLSETLRTLADKE